MRLQLFKHSSQRDWDQVMLVSEITTSPCSPTVLCIAVCSTCVYSRVLVHISVLTSVEHHSWIMEMMCVSFICRVNAASHSGSISMCCPTCLTTGSIPWDRQTHRVRARDRQAAGPGKCQVCVSRCVLPAYTWAVPEKLQTLQETLFWADRSTQRDDWWARTCRHTHTQLVYKLIYNWCITVNEPVLTWGLRWGSGLVRTWRPAGPCSGRTGSVPAGLCDGGDPQTSWWWSSSGFLPPSASEPVTHTGRHDFITNITDCVNSSSVLIYWWHYATLWMKY